MPTSFFWIKLWFCGNTSINKSFEGVNMTNSEKLQYIKTEILNLKGQHVNLVVNKGRKKIIRFNGVIENVYPSMFVIKPIENVDLDRTSFSYNDVLCGDISYTI